MALWLNAKENGLKSWNMVSKLSISSAICNGVVYEFKVEMKQFKYDECKVKIFDFWQKVFLKWLITGSMAQASYYLVLRK